MRKSKWRSISGISFMVFMVSLMYTLKTYQVLGKEMLNITNGIVFTMGTVIFAIVTIMAFGVSLKKHRK